MAQELQFSVTPENQPQDTASLETMRMYSSLNQQLADATEEPASSCLKSYAVYQACKAGDSPAGCGAAPSCRAVAPLPMIDFAGVRFNFPAGLEDTAVLTPRAPRAAIDPAKIKTIPQDSRPPAVSQGIASGGGGGVSGGGAVVEAPRASPTGPARIAGGVIAGARTSFVQPKYPQMAKLAHLSGTVVLRAIISKTGTIEDLEVSFATSPMFVLASINAVRQWTYRPYLLNGQPTEVDTTITVNYAMTDPSKKPPVQTGPPQNSSPQFPQ
jgi:TonB family protein